MKEKWRQVITIFLISAIFFLCVTADFYHQHHGLLHGPQALVKNEKNTNEISVKQLHNFICLACLYGFTQVAPDLSFQTLKPNQDALFTSFRESTFYFVILPTHFYLRAPPAQFS